MLMGKLPLAQQQLVEFAKALSYDPAVLILDEPTSALSCAEQDILYEKIRLIKSLGVAVVFISHKLDEIKALSDRITVLRDGHKIFTKNANELNKEEIIASIVGKPAERKQSSSAELKRRVFTSSPVTVEVQNLSMERGLDNVSFKLHKGEMLGISGVSGSGISEIGKILFGIEDTYTGSILLDGEPYASASPLEAVSKGFGYVPKDRKEEGIIPEMSVGDNIVLSTLKQICAFGFVHNKKKNELVNKIMDTTDLRPRNSEIAISSLSGGNQQKVVMARWISKESRVLILDEPTRGVDVGAIQKIYSLIRDLADKGMSVIVISSEFEEVHAATDRMIILNKGKIVGEINPAVNRWEDAFAMAVN
jgi:ABC-type sugar transport system ATPase subunit